jgi:hypothetical protein
VSKQKRAGGQAARPDIPLALAPSLPPSSAPVLRDRVAMMGLPERRPDPPRTVARHRAGHVLARVIVDRVRALGNDGTGARIVWLRGEVGRFSQSEIDSLPGAFELLPEEPSAA